MTTPCVTAYPVLKSVTLTTLGFYCKASGKAVIISLLVFRKHLRGVPPWWRPGMQKFMGGGEISRAFRAMLWIHGRKTETGFTAMLLSLVTSGTRFLVYVKGLAKRIHLTD